MGRTEQKYTKTPTLENEDEFPIATAIPSGTSLTDDDTESLPTASQVGQDPKGAIEEGDDGIIISWEKGEVQPSAFRDKWFAIFFLVQLFGVISTAFALWPSFYRDAQGVMNSSEGSDSDAASQGVDESDQNHENNDIDDGASSMAALWTPLVSSLIVAPLLSIAAMVFMSRNAIALIHASIWISIGLCALVAVLNIAVNPLGSVIFGVLTGCLVCYARAVRDKIPYAAENLKCAIAVVKTNFGLVLLSFGATVSFLGYSVIWVLAFGAAMNKGVMWTETTYDSSDAFGGDDDWTMASSSSSNSNKDLSALGGFVGFFFILSFYWTHEVIKNVVRTTVAGVVGTWWFSPSEASSFCSSAVRDSFFRSTTYSLGSICFGSLIVAVLHIIRNSLRRTSNNRDAGILRCMAHCILAYIEALVEYFNKWAFIYCGIYGYSYVEAGKRVMNLFKTRGWSTIISDNLINRLLGIMCLGIGVLIGLFTLFVSFLVEEIESQSGWAGFGFFIGFVMGLVLSGLMMGLLANAVDSIIVCYAECPAEFGDSHPELAGGMQRTWSQAWSSLELTGQTAAGLHLYS
mmetsp:Transcript_16338/g.34181  ORF Transcript_16338/g.34181 Transcript_16338/m.34181 type:complete len:574 (+) Transcript_16338:106-1827(+)